MSRNWTFKAENHKPKPREVIKARSNKSGSQMTFFVGKMPKKAIIRRSTMKASMKSTIPDRTAEIGMIRRGKKTFLIKFELPTRLLDELFNPLAKNCQGTNAA